MSMKAEVKKIVMNCINSKKFFVQKFNSFFLCFYEFSYEAQRKNV